MMNRKCDLVGDSLTVSLSSRSIMQSAHALSGMMNNEPATTGGRGAPPASLERNLMIAEAC